MIRVESVCVSVCARFPLLRDSPMTRESLGKSHSHRAIPHVDDDMELILLGVTSLFTEH